MLASRFAFLRRSAAVMANDLSRTPVTGLPVAACGDMHVANFGVYASAERNLVFEDVPLIVRETHSELGTPIRDAMNAMVVAYVDSLPLDRRRLLARYRIVDAARKASSPT